MVLPVLSSKVLLAIIVASSTYGIDPKLLTAIAIVESSGRESAVGSLGEIGLMQMRPEFHPCASFDAVESALCAARYLKKLKKLKQSKWGNAWFVSYNYGPNKKVDEPKKTSYYVKVTRVMRLLKLTNKKELK